MCTAICAGSPATTSFAESLNPASVHLSKTSSGYSVLEASAMSENASNEVSATAASSAEEFLSEESPTDFSTPGQTYENTSDAASESTPDSASEAVTDAPSESSSDAFSESPSTEENMTETSEQETSETSSTEELSTEEPATEDLSTEELTTEEQTTEEILSAEEQRSIDVEEATDAFHLLLQEKQLMALLYHTDRYDVARNAGSYDASVVTLRSGHTLYITDVEILDDQVWYQVSFWINGKEQSGYIEGYYLAYSDEDWIAWERAHLAGIYPDSRTYGITAYPDAVGKADTSDIAAFPALYQEDLRSLKEQHPTWTFVPMYTGLDFGTAVSNEMGAKSLIQNTSSNAAKGWVGSACPTESGWYYATKPAVMHYMNPCNFLTENYIFQFEQLTFNSSYHNVSAIQTFLGNTFMKGKIPSDSSGRTYAQAFFEIGKNRRLSPIHLASRVYQEQGNGTSALISGTYKGFEGYYNYFNVGVSGSSTEEKSERDLPMLKRRAGTPASNHWRAAPEPSAITTY